MTVRFVLMCDRCGAISDDHYPFPKPLARKLARGTGWSYRRKSQPGGYKNHPLKSGRLWVDLCPEHTYSYDLWMEPVRNVREPQPMATEEQQTDDRPPQVVYPQLVVPLDIEGDGAYRVYAQLANLLRGIDVPRSRLVLLRREMFAPDADPLAVASRWVTVVPTEEHDDEETRINGGGPPQGVRSHVRQGGSDATGTEGQGSPRDVGAAPATPGTVRQAADLSGPGAASTVDDPTGHR